MILPPPSVAPAYDAIARGYDSQLAQNPVAVYMRERLHRHLARVFQSGDRVLDFTAGTGTDACFLARRGLHMIALDISPAMLSQARLAAESAGVDLDTRGVPAERLGELGLRELDGAISTFGGLNTIADMPRLARDLGECVKPRGRVILHALNRFCFWEWVRGYAADRRTAREVQIGQALVMHYFYNPFELQAIFAPYFNPRSVYALSVIAAPALVRRFPSAAPMFFALDRMVGRIFPAAGDFFVLELERRDV